MNRLAPRVVKLEQDAPHVRRLSHEDALAELDAGPRPLPDDPGFSDEELDAAWARLTGAWSEGR